MRGLEAVIDGVIGGAGWVAKASALLIVLVVTGNVLMRYGFSMGTVALQELQWHLVPPIALLGLGYSLHHGEHVRVDVFYEHMRARTRHAVDLVTALLTVLIALYLAYLSLDFVSHSYRMGESSSDPGGLPARYVLKAFLPLGFAVLALQGVAGGLRCLRSLGWLSDRSASQRSAGT